MASDLAPSGEASQTIHGADNRKPKRSYLAPTIASRITANLQIFGENVLKERNGIFAYRAGGNFITFDRGFIKVESSTPIDSTVRPVLAYRFSEIRIGNALIASANEKRPDARAEQRTISYLRGVVEERYHLGKSAVEQDFVIRELPASRGAITITGTVSTNLTAPADGTTATTLAFTDQGHQKVSFSKAVVSDASRRILPLQMTYAKGNLSMVVPARWVAKASLPITIDPVIGSPITIDSSLRSANYQISDISYNSARNTWLVIWNEWAGSSFGNNVYGQIVDAAGNLVGSRLAIGASAADEWGGTVSYAPAPIDRWLVTWVYIPPLAGSNGSQIEGAVLNGDGTFYKPPFLVDKRPNANFYPTLAYDGVNWHVTWTNLVISAKATPATLVGRFVSTAGVPGAIADVQTSPVLYQYISSQAFANGRYTILWRTGLGATSQLLARTMDPAGKLSPVTTMSSAGPAISSVQVVPGPANRLLLVWPAGSTVSGRIVDANLANVSGPLSILSGQECSAAYSEKSGEWLVVAGGSSLQGALVDVSGTVSPAETLAPGSPVSGALAPRVAWNSTTDEMLAIYNVFPVAGSIQNLKAVRYRMPGPAGSRGGSGGSTNSSLPTVSVTAPSNGATVSGTVTVSASASDTAGIARVEFLSDGTVFATKNSAPYTASWETTMTGNGPISLTARAYNVPGQSSTASISLTVSNSNAPAPVYVYRVSAPDVSLTRAQNLASQVFGFNGNALDTNGSISITEAAASDGRSLTLYKPSGAIEYVDEAKYRNTSYNVVLPADPLAIQIAHAFLNAHGLMPPNSTSSTYLDPVTTSTGEAPNAIAVTFEPQLALSNGVNVPVRDGNVTVWLGNAGEIIRFQSLYRKVDAVPLSVPRRTDAEALADIAHNVKSTSGLILRPAYVVFDSDQAQPYLDPMIEAVDSLDRLADRARATRFTPRLALLSPAPSIPAADPTVAFTAAATDGMPPYTFRWESSLDGLLGTAGNLKAQLSPGNHRIDLTVRDARGAGITSSFLFDVTPATLGFQAPVAGPPQQQPVQLGQKTSFSGDFKATVQSDANRPIILNGISRSGYKMARNIYFDQFWYEITVDVNGTPVKMRSLKCRAKIAAGASACAGPTAPFAQSTGSTPLTVASTGDGQVLNTTVTIGNLPGTFTLNFDYGIGVKTYAGPEPGAWDKTKKFILDYAPFSGYSFVYDLGGSAPGIRPKVSWTYAPYYASPAFFIGQTILDFCGQSRPNDPPCTPAAVLTNIRPDRQYQVTGFRARLLTAVQSNGTGVPEVASLVQDTSKKEKLGNTVGAIDRSPQPSFAPDDFLVFLTPMMNEMRVHSSQPQRAGSYGGFRADFDNVHLKAFPDTFGGSALAPSTYLPVAFPNCNWPLDRDARGFRITDERPCVHLHESWLDTEPGPSTGLTYSKGQDVYWNVLLFRAGAEESPDAKSIDAPLDILNNERLRISLNNDPFFRSTAADLVLWVESFGDSKQCKPKADGTSGDVNNSSRPCEVFPQGMFLSPR